MWNGSKWSCELNPAFTDQISASYEFLHVATYGNNTPHTVVFINDNGFLKVPASKFEMGDYEEWKDTKTLPVREVARAASALSMLR